MLVLWHQQAVARLRHQSMGTVAKRQHIIVRRLVDHDVHGIDAHFAGPAVDRRIDHHIEVIVTAVNGMFRQIQHGRQVVLAQFGTVAEHADVEALVERHFVLTTLTVADELARVRVDTHQIFAIDTPRQRCLGRVQIKQHDAIKKISNQLLLLGRGAGAEFSDEVSCIGEGRFCVRAATIDY